MKAMRTTNALHVSGISVAYGDRPALDHLSFDLQAGNVLGVIGPNGAGKTTLVRAVSGVVPIRAGSIRWKGQDLVKLPADARARLVAVVPQARSLPPAFTGWETVLLGRTPYLNWLVRASIQDEELAHNAMQWTDTIDLAARRIGELSGGEQQRLLLARALAQATPLLLLDEPITHLDLRHQVNFLGMVRELARQRNLTVLMVLHDLNMAIRYSDLLLVLVHGERVAFGGIQDVLDAKQLESAFDMKLHLHKLGGSRQIILPE
jgi:ABC-type cobalamin/Fe3+-siderophores transport system ATPase subunit